MTTLDSMMNEYQQRLAVVTHLLLVGHTKLGKSDYCAQAAIDGWRLIYIDADNGLATLKARLENHPEALRRVHYFSPVDILDFIQGLLTKPRFRYSLIKQREFVSGGASPDERVFELIPSRIPQDVIVCIDSWTATAFAAHAAAAKRNGISLLSIDKNGREIYGPSNHQLTQLLTLLQHAPFNLIVQAHPTIYERKEKPPGVVREVKEADMIIRETIEIPQSSSAPHGATLGKFFNQIGWLGIDRADRRILDFKVKQGRVGGGTPGGTGDPRGSYSWNNLFGPPPVVDESTSNEWFREYTAAEFAEEKKNQFAAAPKIGAAPAAAKPVAKLATNVISPQSGLKLTPGILKKG